MPYPLQYPQSYAQGRPSSPFPFPTSSQHALCWFAGGSEDLSVQWVQPSESKLLQEPPGQAVTGTHTPVLTVGDCRAQPPPDFMAWELRGGAPAGGRLAFLAQTSAKREGGV